MIAPTHGQPECEVLRDGGTPVQDVAPDWDAIGIPADLPELRVVPDSMHVFMFSAITWNRHRIHYDKDEALREGLPGIVVQRALLGNYLARLVNGWLGEAGALTELSWRVLRSALPDRALRCRGQVVEKSRVDGVHILRCDLAIVNEQDETVASGAATIRMEQAVK